MARKSAATGTTRGRFTPKMANAAATTATGRSLRHESRLLKRKEQDMPVIVVRALEIVVSYLPRISADLKRIADALEITKAKENNNDK